MIAVLWRTDNGVSKWPPVSFFDVNISLLLRFKFEPPTTMYKISICLIVAPSYPQLICSPSFLPIPSKMYFEIPCTRRLRSNMTAAGRNATLQKRIAYPRSQPKLTQPYPSSDVSNVHARIMCSVKLSTNKMICGSE